MRAAVGDRMVVASGTIEGPVSDGEVLEVRGPDGSGPYVVRWSDTGHETLYWPGSDAHVGHIDAKTVDLTAEPTAQAEVPHVKTWRVDLYVYEHGHSTSAHAVLHGEAPIALESRGEARRNPAHREVPEIGDEVAVARALRRLADRLLGVAADDIAAASGAPVRLAP